MNFLPYWLHCTFLPQSKYCSRARNRHARRSTRLHKTPKMQRRRHDGEASQDQFSACCVSFSAHSLLFRKYIWWRSVCVKKYCVFPFNSAICNCFGRRAHLLCLRRDGTVNGLTHRPLACFRIWNHSFPYSTIMYDKRWQWEPREVKRWERSMSFRILLAKPSHGGSLFFNRMTRLWKLTSLYVPWIPFR